MDDPIYRRLFSFPRMVEGLLRAVVRAPWLDDVDFGTLEKLSADHVGDRGQQRRGDAVWRVRFRDGWLYLLILLEFQSRNDAVMALRMLEYTALLYGELNRRRELGRTGRWPPVLPVVVYSGDAPWTAPLEMRELIAPVPAPLEPCQPRQRSLLLDEQRLTVDDLPLANLVRAVAGLEQSRTPTDVARVATALRGWLRDPGDPELARAFASWLWQISNRMDPMAPMPSVDGLLEESSMSLLDRVAQWPEQWRQEAVAEGFEQQRALLTRQAALRFGPDIGERVGALLAGVANPDEFATVAEWVVALDDGVELTDRVAALAQPAY